MRDCLLGIELIGYAAGTLTTISLIPEIYRTWKRKEARDLSFYWLGTMCTGQALWVAYGVYISSLPIVAANSVSVFLCLVQATLILKYNGNARARRR